MRRHAMLLLTIPMLAGCELDMLGPDWDEGCFLTCGGEGWGYGDYTPASVRVSGRVLVGEYEAMWEEARILLYAPSDTVSPVDSISVDGRYWRDFGPAPGAAVCAYLARAVLWSGESTGLQPLFPTATSCEPTPRETAGPTFRLPAYPVLAEPFVLRGTVLVNGQTPQPGDVQLALQVRHPVPGSSPATFTTSSDGSWSFEVTDGAQRFALCRWVDVEVRHLAVVASDQPRLGLPSSGICGSERVLPDVRIGTLKAAVVQVQQDVSPGVLEVVPAGAAKVSLRLPADSSLIGEESATLDDGTAHVWFPHDMTSPGCSFLLKVELGARVQYHPLQSPGATTCYEGQFHSVQFVGS